MADERELQERQGTRPSDTEALAGDTAASRPLTDAPRVQPSEIASREAAAGSPAGSQTAAGGAAGDPAQSPATSTTDRRAGHDTEDRAAG